MNVIQTFGKIEFYKYCVAVLNEMPADSVFNTSDSLPVKGPDVSMFKVAIAAANLPAFSRVAPFVRMYR